MQLLTLQNRNWNKFFRQYNRQMMEAYEERCKNGEEDI